jgi:hypothetical protein
LFSCGSFCLPGGNGWIAIPDIVDPIPGTDDQQAEGNGVAAPVYDQRAVDGLEQVNGGAAAARHQDGVAVVAERLVEELEIRLVVERPAGVRSSTRSSDRLKW